MSAIFFVSVEPTETHEAGIECQIFSDDGRRLASHLMTIDGARVRMHDLQAAIRTAERDLRRRTNRLSASIRRARTSA